jgi:type VI secretion system protein ImpC
MAQDDQDRVVKKVEAGFSPTGESLPQMPLKTVVFSELMPRDLRTGRSAERRRRVPVNAQSFDDVVAGFGLRAFLDVPDCLGGGKDPLIVEVEIRDLKSFRPEALADSVPAARDLLKLRGALADLRMAKTRLADVRDLLNSLASRSKALDRVRAALAAEAGGPETTPPPSPSSRPPGGLDALLEQVGAPDAPADSPSGRFADLDRLDALVRHLARSSRTSERVDAGAVEGAIREIDAAVSEQLDAVLHHPELRRLEAAWRGLKLLVQRTDFERGVKIELVACGREQLISALDELVVVPESQGISAEPIGFIAADFEFDRSPGDIDTLEALAERGASLSAPIIVAIGAPFLGLARAGDLAGKPGVKDVFESPEYVKWKGLRDSGPSRWLGAAFNRFLLRPAYAPGEWATRGFDYREEAGGGFDANRAWGSPVWAVAILAVRSFARIGWCTDMMGQRASGTVEDLPVRLYERKGGEAVSFPMETTISDDVERDLTQNGVMALSSPLDSDRAFLRFAPSVHAPQHYQDALDKARAKLQSTLPFQMFVGRLVNYAMLVEGLLVSGRGPEQIAAGYDRALRGLIGSAGHPEPDAVQVAVVPGEQDPSSMDLCLKVRWPGAQSLPGAGEVEMRWPIQI